MSARAPNSRFGACAEAIARPTRLTQALLVVAVLAVGATRVQGIVLLPVAVTAVLVDAWLARSWANLRRLVPAAAVLKIVLGHLWRTYVLGEPVEQVLREESDQDTGPGFLEDVADRPENEGAAPAAS